jgi:hypothetical protein
MTENILTENSDQKFESALDESGDHTGVQENQTFVTQQKPKL